MARGSKPGERRGGRKKGTPNKLSGELKECVIKAAELAGNEEGMVGYLKEQAVKNPAPFMGLLGKVLPMQLEHGVSNEVADLLRELNGKTKGLPR